MDRFPWFALALVIGIRLPAQSPHPIITTGVWRGWVQLPDQDSMRVTYLVEADKKHTYITLRSRGQPDFGFGDIKLKNDVLTFSWAIAINSTLFCRLSRRGTPNFDGVCEDNHRDLQGKQFRVFMQMNAPRDSTGTERGRL